MTIHLLKLCVGADCVEDLRDWVKKRVARNEAAGRGVLHDHVTRMFPKKRDELLDGGSIFWVIKGVVLVRQKIADVKAVTGADGTNRCAILLAPKLIETEAQPRRAFQGWRYLAPEDAPRDICRSARREPPELRARLAELGLL